MPHQVTSDVSEVSGQVFARCGLHRFPGVDRLHAGVIVVCNFPNDPLVQAFFDIGVRDFVGLPGTVQNQANFIRNLKPI
jgi:hypothetical protein